MAMKVTKGCEFSMINRDSNLPHARKEGLLIEDVQDETLVYDLDGHKAHCLNKTAALVWKRCDGQKSVRDIAQILTAELGVQTDEQVVWFALDQLGKAHLLQRRIQHPERARLSRRQLIQRVGWAAIAVPIVTSLLAPTALAGLSCGQFTCVPVNNCPTLSGCICSGSPANCVAS